MEYLLSWDDYITYHNLSLMHSWLEEFTWVYSFQQHFDIDWIKQRHLSQVYDADIHLATGTENKRTAIDWWIDWSALWWACEYTRSSTCNQSEKTSQTYWIGCLQIHLKRFPSDIQMRERMRCSWPKVREYEMVNIKVFASDFSRILTWTTLQQITY